MRPVNLIPVEERRGEKTPLRTGPVSYAIVGVLAVALLGATLMVLTGNQISDRKTEVSQLQAQVAQAEARSKQLSAFGQFAALQKARQDTVSNLAQSRFDWERVLRELAIVAPSDVWLTDVTGSASAGSAPSGSTSSGASSATAGILGPSLQIQGCSDGHEAVASFLAALRDIDGVTRVTVMNSDRQDSSGVPASTATGGSSTGASTSCPPRQSVSAFQIVMAFDNAPQAGTATAAPTPSTTPDSSTTSTTSTTSTSDSQVADGQQQLQQQSDSIKKQTAKARDAASSAGSFVSGTGTTP
jgi:Tfp pilus assembly protein PilN